MTSRRARVSGHYAGAFTRLLAFLVDWFAMSAIFSFFAALTVAAISLLTPWEVSRNGSWPWVAAFVLWGFFYFWSSMAIAGKTLGMALVGLRVVARDGSVMKPRQAFLRTLVMPLSVLALGIGALWILVDPERRALHDIIAGTVVVYDWGDRTAEMPAPLTSWLRRHDADRLDMMSE